MQDFSLVSRPVGRLVRYGRHPVYIPDLNGDLKTHLLLPLKRYLLYLFVGIGGPAVKDLMPHDFSNKKAVPFSPDAYPPVGHARKADACTAPIGEAG